MGGAALAARGDERPRSRLCAWLAFAVCARHATGGFEYSVQQRIESARLFGNMNKYAYYFTDLLVGSPVPQRASVIIDTGSRLVGFPCNDCEHCGEHLDPAYDTSQSASLRWLNCSHDCPDMCLKDHCPYTEAYAEGSEISGFWFDDFVELGDAFNKNPPVRIQLGCHTTENNLFFTQRANGIMGLAPETGIASQPTILQQLFRDSAHVNSEVFSICLATWGGRITVGGYNDTHHIRTGDDDPIQWIEMRASHYYYVNLDGISIGDEFGTEVVSGAEAFGVTIVDSGTTFTYLPDVAFHKMTASLSDYCQAHDECGGTKEYTQDEIPCWRLEAGGLPANFPSLRFKFQESHVDWWATSYLLQKGDDNVWCQAFLQSRMYQTVLGISFMLHKDFIFDIAHSRIGVADADCPEYREQPALEPELIAGFAAPGAAAAAGLPRVLAAALAVSGIATAAGLRARALRSRQASADEESRLMQREK